MGDALRGKRHGFCVDSFLQLRDAPGWDDLRAQDSWAVAGQIAGHSVDCGWTVPAWSWFSGVISLIRWLVLGRVPWAKVGMTRRGARHG